jgi:zinc protease
MEAIPMRAKSYLLLFVVIFSTAVEAGPQIQHWNTANGARVYFVPAPELPMVDVSIVFDAGAARDADAPGVALLTNGLLAEGAGSLDADQLAERFESLGAEFSNNAERDMATLSLRTLSDAALFDPAVDTLTTILTRPDFPTAAFAREQSRLLQSIAQRKQDPGELADEAFYKAVYGEHPYATLPSGTEASVKAITPAKLKNFYQRYYVGANAVVAIVGNLDRSAAEKLAERVMGKLPAGRVAENLPEVRELAQATEVRIEHPAAQTHIVLGQPGMTRDDADYFPLYVGNHMLGGSGLVARLSDEIREKRGLAYSTYSYFLPMRKQGPYTIGAQTRNESAQESLTVLRDTVATFVKDGPTAQELESSKKNITGGFPLRISSNKKIVEYIAMIGFYELPLDYLDTFNSKVDAVTADNIKDAFQRRVHPDKMVTVLVGGGNGGK